MRLLQADHPGCYNRKPFIIHHWVKNGIYPISIDGEHAEGAMRMKRIPNVMSTKCRSDYDINKEGRCKGCTVGQDHEYFERTGL